MRFFDRDGNEFPLGGDEKPADSKGGNLIPWHTRVGPMLASDIIQQLNEDRRFPLLGPWFPVDVRLSVYRDERQWAIVMEMLVFNQQRIGHECCMTQLYCFGSDFPPSAASNYSELHVTKDGPSGPLFDPDDFMQHHVSLAATDMTIRGNVVPITTDPGEYAAAGIKLEHPPRIWGYELLRLIAPRHRRLFFATEAEIVERIGEPMPLLLRLNEWRHPDGVEEMLWQSESFQMIADVIANDDPLLYQPTVTPNTHWSNWPNAGDI
jgi:hypothetical protein